MNAVIAVAAITSPMWLLLPIAALGERTGFGRWLTAKLDAALGGAR